MKKHIITLLTVLLFLSGLYFQSFSYVIKAEGEDLLSDGKYLVPIEKDIYMGGENVEDDAILEKIGNNYYLTLKIKDVTKMADVTLDLKNGKVGTIIRKEGVKGLYTYALGKEDVESKLHFIVYVPAMGKDVDVYITLDIKKAKKRSDFVDDIGIRPAPFVPNIEVDLSSGEMEKGSEVIIPKVKATLLGKDIPIKIESYYLKDGKKQIIDISKNKLFLEYIGEYHIIFTAESDLYKRSDGSNTKEEKDIKIISKLGATSIVKIDNDIIKEGFQINGSYLEDGKDYDNIKLKLKDISDNFQVVKINIYNNNGDVAVFDEKEPIKIRVDDKFNRNDMVVYSLLKDNTLKELDFENYGRYIQIEVTNSGNYIFCTLGVEFHMPMWGYAVILALLILFIIAIIITIIVIVKKNKNKRGKFYEKY